MEEEPGGAQSHGSGAHRCCWAGTNGFTGKRVPADGLAAGGRLTLNTSDLEQISAQHPPRDPLFHTIFGCEERKNRKKSGQARKFPPSRKKIDFWGGQLAISSVFLAVSRQIHSPKHTTKSLILRITLFKKASTIFSSTRSLFYQMRGVKR